MLKYNYLKAYQPRLFAIQHLLPSFKENLTVKTYSVNLHLPSYFLCLKPILFSILAITSLLTILVNSAHGLNVTTANEIHGSAPYLTYDGGITKADSTESLLGITLSDGKVINALNDESSLTNPIELPHQEDTYASIQTIVPLPTAGNSNYPIVNMTDLLEAPYNYFGDDDGDGYASNGNVIATATGQISLKWEVLKPGFTDVNAKDAFMDITSTVKNNPNAVVSLCNSLYRLTINASDGELKTMYGQPNKSYFIGANHYYYFKANHSSPSVCYVQPNLALDNASNNETWISLDGPLWDSAKSVNGNYRGYPSQGYRVINASNSGNYYGPESVTRNNFPSTGSHGLHFYVLLAGIKPDEVLAANGSTVKAVEGGNVSLSLSVGKTENWEHKYKGVNPYGAVQTALKVKLVGPRYNSIDKSFKPATFRLYADSGKRKLLYEFKLMRWYITEPYVSYGTAKDAYYREQELAKNHCKNLGSNYYLPDINDLTNADGFGDFWMGGVPNQFSGALRQLSYVDFLGKWAGGINNEWGCLSCSGYSESDWNFETYWTTNIVEYSTDGWFDGDPLIATVDNGLGFAIRIFPLEELKLGVTCVTP